MNTGGVIYRTQCTQWHTKKWCKLMLTRKALKSCWYKKHDAVLEVNYVYLSFNLAFHILSTPSLCCQPIIPCQLARRLPHWSSGTGDFDFCQSPSAARRVHCGHKALALKSLNNWGLMGILTIISHVALKRDLAKTDSKSSESFWDYITHDHFLFRHRKLRALHSIQPRVTEDTVTYKILSCVVGFA